MELVLFADTVGLAATGGTVAGGVAKVVAADEVVLGVGDVPDVVDAVAAVSDIGATGDRVGSVEVPRISTGATRSWSCSTANFNPLFLRIRGAMLQDLVNNPIVTQVVRERKWESVLAGSVSPDRT